VLVAVVAGALVGAIVGGLGGRVAMRLIAAWTEGPFFTLGGDEVGVVSLEGTLALIGSAAQGGAIVGVFYAVLRWALPQRHRAGVFALLVLLVLGGVFLGDTEFELFEPSLVAVALLLPLFPAAGFGTATLTETLDPRPAASAWTRRGKIAVAVVAFAGLAALLRNLARLA
jgi:hypothetical protein